MGYGLWVRGYIFLNVKTLYNLSPMTYHLILLKDSFEISVTTLQSQQTQQSRL